MPAIRQVSDPGNKCDEIEKNEKNGQPLYLIETALDLADQQAASSSIRLSAEEVFSAAGKVVNG